MTEQKAGVPAKSASTMRWWRRKKDVAITGWNAVMYDRQGRRYRQEEFGELARQLAQRITSEQRILEIASGSGYLAIELARLGRTRLVGSDISADQVAIATENARRASTPVEFVVAGVQKLPFADSSFDFALCFAAFKNFRDPAGALKEMKRVLAPGGSVIIGDMCSDIPDGAIEDYLDGQRIRGLNRIILGRTFRFLRKGAYSHAELQALIDGAGYSSYRMEEGGIGFSLTLTK
ncbi:MAG TPA: class I SAM-dependent methyltransferase [Spirochaetia bacterium]|nr:class I SAM-dependent methyltransferase [Spirochaetia bacterium]